MNFRWKKKANIKLGQKLFGVIGVSPNTYDGVYPVTLDYIDWNEERLIFVVDQPCGRVSCSFREARWYVFESEAEAEASIEILKKNGYGLSGLFAY